MSKLPPIKSPAPPRSIAGMHYAPVTPTSRTGKSRIVKYPTTLNVLRAVVGPGEARGDANLVIGARGGSPLIPRSGGKPSPSERSKPSIDALRLLQPQAIVTFTSPGAHTHQRPAPSLPRLEATTVLDAAALGDVVRIRRQMLRLSQKELADQAGVGRRFIGELESGKATLELGKALAVCQALRISLTAELTDG